MSGSSPSGTPLGWADGAVVPMGSSVMGPMFWLPAISVAACFGAITGYGVSLSSAGLRTCPDRLLLAELSLGLLHLLCCKFLSQGHSPTCRHLHHQWGNDTPANDTLSPSAPQKLCKRHIPPGKSDCGSMGQRPAGHSVRGT